MSLLMTLRDQERSGKVTNLTTAVTDEDAVINQLEYTNEEKQDLRGTKVFTDECIAAQSYMFLAVGSGSTSAAIGFNLYALASNTDVQSRLQQEVDGVLAKHKQWSYQAVKEMTYLDQIIQESLRMFTLGFILTRRCCIPYKIPGTEITVEKGVRVTIPTFSLHNDPRYYPDPDVFNPDRFQDNNYKPTIFPRPYFPFGNGPKICIAMKFAILQMKICLARIISEYFVTVSEKTMTPVQWEPKSLLPRPRGGIWLKFTKRPKF